MRTNARIVSIYTLGLAAILASSAIALALPNYQTGKKYCVCACRTTKGPNVIMGWDKTKTCSLSNNQNCNGTVEGKSYPGKLHDCSECTGLANGNCDYTNGGTTIRQQPGGTLQLQPASPAPSGGSTTPSTPPSTTR